MKQLKWFWVVNYVFSSYRVLVLLFLVVGIALGLSNNAVLVIMIDYLTFHQTIKPFSMGFEVFQFILCGLILVVYKEQQNRFHFWYLGILLALIIAEVLAFAFLMLSLR